MPNISDYSEEEDDQSGGGGGTSSGPSLGGGGAMSGAKQAQPSKQQETGFVPWSRFVSANADVSKREADKLQSGVKAQGDSVKKRGFEAESAFGKSLEGNYAHQGEAEGPADPGAWLPAGGVSVAPVAEAQRTMAPEPTGGQPAGGMSSFGKSPAAGWGGLSGQRSAEPAAQQPQLSMVPGQQVGLRTGVTTGARDKGPQGHKSLEDMMGGERWMGLLGDAKKADDSAKALGSEAGVQSLLQKQGAAPNSAFDAALISGAGGAGFRQASKQGQGNLAALGQSNLNSQGQWQRLLGDIGAAQDQKKLHDDVRAQNERNLAASSAATTPAQAPTETKPNSLKGPGFNPGAGDGSYRGFMDTVGKGQFGLDSAGIHALSQNLDPVSRAQVEAGKNGTFEGYTVSEQFRSGSAKGDLDNQNRVVAFHEFEKDFGPEAAQFLWDNLNQAVWDGFAGKNWGFIYYTLKQLLEAYKKSGAFKATMPNPKSEVKGTGTTGETFTDEATGQTRTTTDEQESARIRAYEEGWGTEWDQQFNSGNDDPQRPGG